MVGKALLTEVLTCATCTARELLPRNTLSLWGKCSALSLLVPCVCFSCPPFRCPGSGCVVGPSEHVALPRFVRQTPGISQSSKHRMPAYHDCLCNLSLSVLVALAEFAVAWRGDLPLLKQLLAAGARLDVKGVSRGVGPHSPLEWAERKVGVASHVCKAVSMHHGVGVVAACCLPLVSRSAFAAALTPSCFLVLSAYSIAYLTCITVRLLRLGMEMPIGTPTPRIKLHCYQMLPVRYSSIFFGLPMTANASTSTLTACKCAAGFPMLVLAESPCDSFLPS